MQDIFRESHFRGYKVVRVNKKQAEKLPTGNIIVTPPKCTPYEYHWDYGYVKKNRDNFPKRLWYWAVCDYDTLVPYDYDVL